MTIKVGVIMDPVHNIDMNKDTTFALALEAQKRGYEIAYILMSDLIMKDEVPFCKARKITFQRETPCFRFLSETCSLPLDDFDFILMRKDPPFDLSFFYATHFLSLCKKAKVINRPSSLREAPEKLYSLNFPQIFPPTLISCLASEVRSFMKEQGGEIIIKPLDGCGGQGIVYLHNEDRNFNSLLEIATKDGSEYIMAQKYLPEVLQGDKRVICVNGESVGMSLLRIPPEGEIRANMHVGGRVKVLPLTERDLWLVNQVSSKLKKDGLYFVGLDVIGDYITEINVTSPTGVQEIMDLGKIDISKMFWDGLSSL